MMGNGLLAPEVSFELEALRGELEYPGKHQEHRKTDRQQYDDDAGRRVAESEQRKDGLGDLDEQP